MLDMAPSCTEARMVYRKKSTTAGNRRALYTRSLFR